LLIKRKPRKAKVKFFVQKDTRCEMEYWVLRSKEPFISQDGVHEVTCREDYDK
jgi:hypothetical protein